MIDRTINLITVFFSLLVLIVLAINASDAWFKTEPWGKHGVQSTMLNRSTNPKS